jgi:hypothetical protein
MKPIVCLLFSLLITGSASRTGQPASPPFSFAVQLEKHVFKPGDTIWALALLRNQSEKDIYVPHVMTTCIGLEAHVLFSLADRHSHAALPLHHGRGCGIGSGSGDGRQSSSFEEHVRSSWILLHPGEIFGARVDTLRDAPEVPGVYQIQAEYLPEPLVTGDHSGPPGNEVRVIAEHYRASPIEITFDECLTSSPAKFWQSWQFSRGGTLNRTMIARCPHGFIHLEYVPCLAYRKGLSVLDLRARQFPL